MFEDVMDDVDVFLGFLMVGFLVLEWVKKMVEKLIIFVLVNFDFEIWLDYVWVVVLDVIIVIGWFDFFN